MLDFSFYPAYLMYNKYQKWSKCKKKKNSFPQWTLFSRLWDSQHFKIYSVPWLLSKVVKENNNNGWEGKWWNIWSLNQRVSSWCLSPCLVLTYLKRTVVSHWLKMAIHNIRVHQAISQWMTPSFPKNLHTRSNKAAKYKESLKRDS